MLKTFGINGYIYAILVLTMALTLGNTVGNFVDRENRWDAFHAACTLNGGKVTGADDYICVVNGKVVLFK